MGQADDQIKLTKSSYFIFCSIFFMFDILCSFFFFFRTNIFLLKACGRKGHFIVQITCGKKKKYERVNNRIFADRHTYFLYIHYQNGSKFQKPFEITCFLFFSIFVFLLTINFIFFLLLFSLIMKWTFITNENKKRPNLFSFPITCHVHMIFLYILASLRSVKLQKL